MNGTDQPRRTIGLWGATGTGVGAIVGGGVLALAGVAFSVAGPSAILAFGLNAGIAVLTALTFAELSSAFPQSGGTYTFAKRVLSVESAFAVGWIVWFASVVAAVLYAIGFGYFFAVALHDLWAAAGGSPPQWLLGRWSIAGGAVAATAIYAVGLVRKSGGGGQWANYGKVLVFLVLIAGGVVALFGKSSEEVTQSLTPFLGGGWGGLVAAMGFTFIALQGFDLIAAVAGEVKDPEKVLPRSMLLSLGIAVAIYLPLLFIITTTGTTDGQSIQEASAEAPEAIVAIASRHFLGDFGYWLVIVAAVLSMLSALRANLFAASRVAHVMARDRTLPHVLSRMHPVRDTPVTAVLVTAVLVGTIILVVGDVAAAGAASSLIFLVTFALAHVIGIIARLRSRGDRSTFRAPFFPLVPVLGGVACVSLAVFQGIAVPSAGLIASVWLGIGGILFLALFGQRARVVDELAAARDMNVARLRGRNPLVLVPVANPAHAESMVALAHALAPPQIGRVLLLTVVVTPENWGPQESPKPLDDAQAVLRASLIASHARGLSPEALTTIAPRPWPEIARIARTRACESLLLGLSDLQEDAVGGALDELMGSVRCDVVVLRAPHGWSPEDIRRVVIPIGGMAVNDRLRARLLGSLYRTGVRAVRYVRVMKEGSSTADVSRATRELERIGLDEAPGQAEAQVLLRDDPIAAIAEDLVPGDLLILGVQRLARRKRAFGRFTLSVARATDCPILMISRRV
jgi:APA family basic amino acid/polyamine antiporter